MVQAPPPPPPLPLLFLPNLFGDCNVEIMHTQEHMLFKCSKLSIPWTSWWCSPPGSGRARSSCCWMQPRTGRTHTTRLQQTGPHRPAARRTALQETSNCVHALSRAKSMQLWEHTGRMTAPAQGMAMIWEQRRTEVVLHGNGVQVQGPGPLGGGGSPLALEVQHAPAAHIAVRLFGALQQVRSFLSFLTRLKLWNQI